MLEAMASDVVHRVAFATFISVPAGEAKAFFACWAEKVVLTVIAVILGTDLAIIHWWGGWLRLLVLLLFQLFGTWRAYLMFTYSAADPAFLHTVTTIAIGTNVTSELQHVTILSSTEAILATKTAERLVAFLVAEVAHS